VQAAAAAAGGELATGLLSAARGNDADRGAADSLQAAATALAPGVAAFAIVQIDRGTGEWAPVSISLAVPGPLDHDRRLALTAGAVDGFGVAAMQQIRFDEQGNCLEATLMDYVMPTSWEAPAITVVSVARPSDGDAPPELPVDLLRTLATAASASAVKSALAVLVPDVAKSSIPITSSDTWAAVAR
jgi:CO/xanthine dehydrogenase Mo-binding subunit